MRDKVLFLFIFFLGMCSMCFAQIKPMGFSQQTITPDDVPKIYYPKLKLIGDSLFVCSNMGIYQKDLKQDSDWELYAFDNIPITEFVKDENKLLAISPKAMYEKENMLLLSTDYGKTYTDYTSSYFFQQGNYNHFFRLVQNPDNPNSILIADLFEGLSQSHDFGESWFNLHPYSIGINWVFASYHPLDRRTLFHSAEGGYFNGTILSSYDSGSTWSEYIVPEGDNCVHDIAFHPTNPNVLVFSGEGVIGKSTNKGATWNVLDVYGYGYLFNILFDEDNPTILYTSPAKSGEGTNNSIYVYRSTDTGETWHLAYKEKLDNDCGGVIDMLKYKNKLIFYTRDCGLFELDLDTPPVSIPIVENIQEITVYPNPVVNTLHFDAGVTVEKVDILDMAGRRLRQIPIAGSAKTVDISQLTAGIYVAVFHTAKGKTIIKKISVTK